MADGWIPDLTRTRGAKYVVIADAIANAVETGALRSGDRLPRQTARGLMWLTLAQDSATADETWIKDSYRTALAKATDDDRAMALQMLERWVQGRRD